MNFDDPRITAYALGELPDGDDQAAVQEILRQQPDLAAELEEIRATAEYLRSSLKSEEGPLLSPAQRETVLKASSVDPLPGANGTIPSSAKPRKVLMGPWSRQRWFPSAIAASVVITTSMGLFWGVQRYAGYRAVMGSSGISDPRALEPTNVVDKAIIRLGDKLVGAPPRSSGTLDDDSEQSVAPMAAQSSVAPQEGVVNEQRLFADWANSPAPADPFVTPGANRAEDISSHFSISQSAPQNAPALAPMSPAAASGPEQTQLRQKVSKELAETALYSSAATASGGAIPDPSIALSQSLKSDSADTSSIGGPVIAAGRAGSPARGRVGGRLDIHPTTESASLGRGFSLVPADALGEPQSGTIRTAPFGSAVGNTEAYDEITDNPFQAVEQHPLSTFSIDVDTASYANVRRFMNNHQRPPKGAVRIEELVNYFPYSYTPPAATSGEPFSTAMEVAPAPWAPQHRLVRVALKGREIAKEKLPPSNLVFLVDVSGSMSPANRLPLVKESLQQLVTELRQQDSVGIVVYAGSSGVVLEPTSDKNAIRMALSRLESGGSTNGAAGIQAAYDLAQRAFKKEGNNRVVLATDGDFNVGVTSQSDLVELIQKKAKSGVFLSVLGFGMGNTKDSTMEKLANKGNGNYAYIDLLREGRKVLVEEMSGTLFTIAKDVKIQVEFNPAKVAGYRLIGYENRILAKEDFNNDAKDAGEIGAGHTVTALYEVVPNGVTVPGGNTVDPLKYQPSLPAVTLQTSPAPGQGDVKQGDFSGSYYLLENTPGSSRADTRRESLTKAVAPHSDELLTLKLRFKQPDGDKSVLRAFPLTDSGATLERSTPDFRWAAAVAGFGMLLRESPHRGSATWETVAALARQGLANDPSGYRSEFLGLIERAQQLAPVAPLSDATIKPGDTPLATDSKAVTILLPEFNLAEASVTTALDALSKASKEADPEKVGIPIVYAGPPSLETRKVNFMMRNISVLEAARTIAQALGLTVKQEGATLILRAE